MLDSSISSDHHAHHSLSWQLFLLPTFLSRLSPGQGLFDSHIFSLKHSFGSEQVDWTYHHYYFSRHWNSIIGSLSFACKVVKSGRLFLRRLIDLSTTVLHLDHHITLLNGEALADIAWWVEFVPSWHGIEFIQAPPFTSLDISLATNASSVGIGAVFASLVCFSSSCLR